ncbi:protein translocase subunit secY/sec61 alpha [Frankineae bacterium MT45]|nr:protein translocase subunit secY/sec61 alpha [Frankineae bacterium MT45]
MLSAFASAFRTPDLRKKLLFTFAMIALYRLGASVPTPNTSSKGINACLNQTANGANKDIYSLINLFSGGALLKLSVFALGIMPYITASIIIQLLVVVIPRFDALKKEGQSGQQKLTQYSRYLTIGLAILQATGFVALADHDQLFQGCTSSILYRDDIFSLATMVVCMTAGTSIIMWMGELVTDRGVGNGMSVLMFTSIAARIPSEGNAILKNSGGFAFFLIVCLGLAIIAAVVFVEQAQRRIPVQYAKRMVGRRQFGGTSTYLPLKVNQAGVIPVIFASSLLYIPQLISQLIGTSTGSFYRYVNNYIINQQSAVHITIYFALIIFFAYFYVSITFNPEERADDMKKYGGFIPGIRPGRPTAEYLAFVLSRITLPGAIYLGIIAVLPNLFFSVSGGNNQNFPFGGTAVLIMVGVGLDTVKQIESQLLQRNYEGFLR